MRTQRMGLIQTEEQLRYNKIKKFISTNVFVNIHLKKGRIFIDLVDLGFLET